MRDFFLVFTAKGAKFFREERKEISQVILFTPLRTLRKPLRPLRLNS